MRLGKVGVIVAARTLSTRLPGKALLPLHGMPMILFLLRRLLSLRSASVVVATTQLQADDQLTALAESVGVSVFRGADEDVVARYVAAAERFGFDTVARVTGDCPFVDAELVDWCLLRAGAFNRMDLATTKSRFPVGLDVEIYPARLMADLDASGTLSAAHREHLTLYLYEHRDTYTIHTIEPREEWRLAGRHFTVDTRTDYEEVTRLAAQFDRPDFPIGALVARAAA